MYFIDTESRRLISAEPVIILPVGGLQVLNYKPICKIINSHPDRVRDPSLIQMRLSPEAKINCSHLHAQGMCTWQYLFS